MEEFKFNKENSNTAEKILKNYAKQESALMPLLHLAQKQNQGWLSIKVLEYIADYLDLSYVKVYEVASFYSMFNLKPIGKYHVQVCGTTPCMLRGAKDVMSAFEKNLHVSCGQRTQDGLFSLTEVECIGACISAPAVQINEDLYENLSPEKVIDLLKNLKKSNPKT